MAGSIIYSLLALLNYSLHLHISPLVTESRHAWCFTYTGQRYGPWSGDLTCRTRQNRWMEAVEQREWWLNRCCFAAWLRDRLWFTVFNSLSLQDQSRSSSKSSHCAFISLCSTGRLPPEHNQGQPSRIRQKPTMCLHNTSHERCRNKLTLSKQTLCDYDLHLLWFFPL